MSRLLSAAIATLPLAAQAPTWQEYQTVADVCRAEPARVEALFAALDLERPDLAAVRAAVQQRDLVTAGEALLAHFRGGDSAAWLRLPVVPPSDRREADADALAAGDFTFASVQDRIPRLADGHLDWDHLGPQHDREFGWCLNRHYLLRDLFAAYRRTGNSHYLEVLDQDLRDWIVSSPYPGKRSSTPRWRGLEAHFRAKIWTTIFFGASSEPELRPATRLLLLCSLPDHADYLRRFHAGGGNWVTMELSALATLAAAFPEFMDAAAWWRYASERLGREVEAQVYPDGVQMELSASYHRVALSNFEQFDELSQHAGKPLPDAFRQRLVTMWDYVARSLRPDGSTPMNNDSDRDQVAAAVRAAARRYGRPDWLYRASQGVEGRRPDGPLSDLWPWAGQLLTRSGFDADALWAFFDFGPWGTGHQHNDMLHLSVAAHGRDLLVDSGRFAYTGSLADKFRRDYALHARGHNVLLIDGEGQGPGPKVAIAAAPAGQCGLGDALDFARGSIGSFPGVQGAIEHTRTLVFLHQGLWIAVDHVAADRPHEVQALWHFHPDCHVLADGLQVLSDDADRGNLRVVPAGSVAWQVQVVRGQEQPVLQGFYSPHYNRVMPSSCAVYTARVLGDAVFAWVLVPGRGVPPPVTAQLQRLDGESVQLLVQRGDGTALQLRVPLSSGAPVLLAPR